MSKTILTTLQGLMAFMWGASIGDLPLWLCGVGGFAVGRAFVMLEQWKQRIDGR